MRVVLANGCFDPLHAGHVLHLHAAKDLGDILVVSITDDASVRREKGAGRPSMGAWQRWAVIQELRCVDSAIIVSGAIRAMELVHPQVFVKGSDYRGRIGQEVFDYCKSHGIEIRFTDTPKYSSTALLNEFRRS